jgi:hypothetical protein
MNCKELRMRCKELQIRGYSKFTKAEMESAIYLKQVSDWYDDLVKPHITFEEEVNIDEEIISLNTNETSEC